MQLAAIINARTIGYIESFDLNPKGTIFFTEIVQEIAEHYHFQKFPKTLQEFDESKGIEFAEGRLGSQVIQKFVIWNMLLVVETRSNTEDSKQILEEKYRRVHRARALCRAPSLAATRRHSRLLVLASVFLLRFFEVLLNKVSSLGDLRFKCKL